MIPSAAIQGTDDDNDDDDDDDDDPGTVLGAPRIGHHVDCSALAHDAPARLPVVLA